LAGTLQVASRVHFLGWREDVPRIAKSVDFLLVPSRWEGMPYIVLEAMAAGRAVVATRVDGARCVVGGTGCGVLAEVGDVASIAAALRRMVAFDPREREALAARGQAALLERFTIERMLDGLLATYAEVA
jgi:glycosyltransferase involved in cell wall biosynthesis